MFESIAEKLGIRRDKKVVAPQTTKPIEDQGGEIKKPLWMEKTEKSLGEKSLKYNLEQSMTEGVTPSGTSTTPTSQDTGVSPFELAARQKTLPAKEIAGSDIQQGVEKLSEKEKVQKLEKGVKAASSGVGSPTSLEEDLELREKLPHP
jgi:hypothetical protein